MRVCQARLGFATSVQVVRCGFVVRPGYLTGVGGRSRVVGWVCEVRVGSAAITNPLMGASDRSRGVVCV